MTELNVVGRAERVTFPSLNIKKVPAKIDTGADVSSIWATDIRFKKGVLHCVFFGPKSALYTGEVFHFTDKEYSVTRIANSFGHREIRYKVKIPMTIKGRTIKATFTLADRSQKLYPVLIGKATLSRKFLVDVSRGSPMREEEERRIKRLQKELSKVKVGTK
jgi:hypothetical protein